MLFLDLAKAFDTVSHDVLLLILKKLGFKLSSVNWFRSYLTNRRQVTTVGDAVSPEIQIKSRGPRMEPWGTPHLICSSEETASLTTVTCLRLVKYDLNQLMLLSLKPRFFNFNSKTS